MDSREQSDLAAEFALGLLDGKARRRAERRLRTDPAFRAEVHDWQSRFTTLFDASRARPPPGAMPRIEERLFSPAPRHRLRRVVDGIARHKDSFQVVALFVIKAGLVTALALWWF